MPDLTVELVKSKVEDYLVGRITQHQLEDWVEEQEVPGMHEQNEAESLVAEMSLMFAEMVCSGQYRSKAMLDADLRSLVVDQPRIAFWTA